MIISQLIVKIDQDTFCVKKHTEQAALNMGLRVLLEEKQKLFL